MVKKEAEAIKRVRILLRVSSSQQLEADGDLMEKNTLKAVSADIKIRLRTGGFCRKPIKTQKIRNMTY